MLKKWDPENKELAQKCIDQVIARVSDIDDPAQVGMIAAQDIIDIVLENMGPEIYNKAINDVSKLVKERLEDLDYSLDELKQS